MTVRSPATAETSGTPTAVAPTRAPRPALRVAPPVAVLVALAAVPFVLGPYPVSLLAGVLAFGVLAMSVSMLTGMAGLPTLGQAGYFGIGGYTAAIVGTAVTTVGPVQILIAAVLAGAVAAATGLVAVRTRGVTFLMLTLAIGELVEIAATEWSSLTGGSDGLSANPVRPFFGLPELQLDGLIYYYVLAIFLVLFTAVLMLARSPFGLALRGIRDNEARMRALGYPVTGYLLGGYAMAGALAGAGGALWVTAQGYISPSDAGFGTSALALLAVTIGGASSVWGVCASAALVLLTRDYLGGLVAGHGPLVLGVMFVLAIYLLPGGVAEVRRRWRRGRSRS